MAEDAFVCDRLLGRWEAGDGSGLVRSVDASDCDAFATAMLVWNHRMHNRSFFFVYICI